MFLFLVYMAHPRMILEDKQMNSALDRQIISEQYRSPIMFALAIQIPIAILCALLLDGGQMARICGIAMAGTWAGILLVMSRRPHSPTFTDHLFIRCGFLLIFGPLVIIHVQGFLR